MKKNSKKVKRVWQAVASRDVRYGSITLVELHSWIKENVPEGTEEEDIHLDFEIDTSYGYYDDVTIDATMVLKVLRK